MPCPIARATTPKADEDLPLPLPVLTTSTPRSLAAAAMLLEWVDEGAAVYVCGSLAGMAPGVDGVLREILGDTQVEALLATGRYRRDVY